MEEVKVLVQGYAKDAGEAEMATSTATLIRKDGISVIVDPGMDRKRLLAALRKEKLTPEKIDFVVLTHYHLDHSLLAGIFKNARVMDDSLIYSWDGSIVEHDGKVPGTGTQIVKAPGHDPFHCAVLVKTAKMGTVAVAGDVFWWPEGEEQKTDRKSLINKEDPYMKDWDKLVASRKLLLKSADHIIPGHGKMFRVQK
jgi:glyoxylase-like metal-dependent hydrolase (beta-lactamase superfamily II)